MKRFYILCLCVGFGGFCVHGDETGCIISKSPVMEGEPVSINCILPANLTSVKQTLEVIRTAPGYKREPPIPILSCDYDGTITCKTNKFFAENFRLHHRNANVSISTSSIRKDQAGNYSCQFGNGVTPDPRSCELVVIPLPYKSSCSVNGVAETAKLECRFHENRTSLQTGFLVIFQPINPISKEEFVVDCHWNISAYNCRKDPGYTDPLETNISDKFTLKIPKRQGRYTCKMYTSYAGKAESCNYTLQENNKTSSDSSTNATETCQWETCCKAPIVIAVVVTVVVTAAIVGLIGLCVWYLRNGHKFPFRNSEQTSSPSENIPMNPPA